MFRFRAIRETYANPTPVHSRRQRPASRQRTIVDDNHPIGDAPIDDVLTDDVLTDDWSSLGRLRAGGATAGTYLVRSPRFAHVDFRRWDRLSPHERGAL
jgi:hypothetical protein